MLSLIHSLCPTVLAAVTLLGVANAQGQAPLLPLSNDSSISFELLVSLGEAIYGGADIAPILGVALDITPGNFSGFSNTFRILADATKAAAQDPTNAYDLINVRDTWFSASDYYRRADFYLHSNWSDPLIYTYWQEQTAAFDNGIAALPVPGKRIQISADNFTIEAIWFATSLEDTKKPTLILGTGYDNAQEDLYHTLVVPALARGYNCLTYEGPGQPSVVRGQHLGFIPEWERVVTPIVDYLLTDLAPQVDASRLALLGYSFGGYLAARAAAFEPRLSAVLLDGGVWDFYSGIIKQIPANLQDLYTSGNKSAFDAAVLGILNDDTAPSTARWGLAQGLWSFQLTSPYDFINATKAYALKDVASQIQMPVWIANSEYDGYFPGQAQVVAAAIGENAVVHNFTGVAGNHCQIGANQELSRTVFAWLHQTLNN